jgi:PAS domain S-box-containing protein
MKDSQEFLRRYGQLFENSPHPSWVFDVETLRILAVNEAAIRHYGYSREEFLAKSLREIRAAGDGPAMVSTGVRYSTTHRKRNGAIIDVEVTGLGELMFGARTVEAVVVEDVSERRRAAAQLKYQAKLLETVNDAVLAFDDGFLLTAWNPAAEAIYGWAAAEVLGRPVHETLRTVFVGTERVDAIRKLVDTGTFSGQLTQFRKDGGMVHIESRTTALKDETNRTIGYVSANRDVTKRCLAEAALEESERQLRALAARLITAQDTERRRVSRELHDDVNQKLAMLAVEVETLECHLRSVQDELPKQVLSIKERLIEVSDDVRQLAYQLHPSVLDDLGLTVALKSYVDDFARREGISVDLVIGDIPQKIPEELASCLYRVAQESLWNVAKHSCSDNAEVHLEVCDETIVLRIQDSGVGCDLDSPECHKPALGITSMRERVTLAKGSFSIRSHPGQGTKVFVSLPLPNAHP